MARWCGWPCGRRAGGGWRKYQHTTQAARRPCWPCLALPLGWRAGVGGVSCLAGRLRGVSLRFRCAGGIITPAAPVALNIRPFPCLVSNVYTSTSRANAGGGLAGLVWPFPVLALRLLGWLAAPVRIIIRRRDYIPARLALPVARIRARFGRFPPFWRPFGVAVVSNAGAVSLRPFRWCRCACKVATPRAALLCRYPQRVQYLRQQSQRETIPATRARRVFTSLAALLLVFGGYRAAAGLCGLLSRGGRIIIRQQSRAALRWRGIAPPPCLPCQLVKKLTRQRVAAGGRAGYRAPPMV